MKRLIDAGHLKDRLMKDRAGSWYDIYSMLALIDSEPTERRGMSFIMLIPAVIFAVIVFAIILYIKF